MIRSLFISASAALISIAAHAEVIHDFQMQNGQSFPAVLGAADFFTGSSAQGLKPDFSNVWHAPQVKGLKGLRSAEDPGCRDRIKTLTCVVDPVDKITAGRPCEAGSEAYAEYFERVYDLFTPTFQKVFCSLDVIYIEKEMPSTAYGGTIDGFTLIGIRKTMLDQSLSFDQVYGWKEQLNFGLDPKSYERDANLPTFETEFAVGPVTGFLYKVLTHEFGHIFDFANHLNAYKDGCERMGGKDCEMAEGSWGALSWATIHTVRADQDFKNRSGLCFYYCDGKFIDFNAINDLYSDLYRSNFVTTYAASNPYDDFADSLAFYMISRKLDAKVKMNTRQGVVYDVLRKEDLPQFASKRQFIENFLSRTDIAYP